MAWNVHLPAQDKTSSVCSGDSVDFCAADRDYLYDIVLNFFINTYFTRRGGILYDYRSDKGEINWSDF